MNGHEHAAVTHKKASGSVDAPVSDAEVMSNTETPSQAKYDAEREAIKHDIRYLLMRISMGIKEDRKRVELQRIQARLAGIVRDYCSE